MRIAMVILILMIAQVCIAESVMISRSPDEAEMDAHISRLMAREKARVGLPLDLFKSQEYIYFHSIVDFCRQWCYLLMRTRQECCSRQA